MRRIDRLLSVLWLALCVTGTLAASVVALHLLGVTRVPHSNHVAPSPQLVVLTDQSGSSASYAINYYQFSDTVKGRTRFGPADQATPVNTRELVLTFKGHPGATSLNWVLLADEDAQFKSPIGLYGGGFFAETRPGQSVTAPACPRLESFPTAQVLSGTVALDKAGHGEVDIVGGVSDTVQYAKVGERTAVNVVTLLPASGEAPNSSDGCTLTLDGWEQVGAEKWHTPVLTSGVIKVGDVPDGSFVESANPALVDSEKLEWDLQGPAAITYTLFDTTESAKHERTLFFAGAVAALAAALLVETIKAVFELVGEGESKENINCKFALAGQMVDRSRRSARLARLSILLLTALVWIFRRTFRKKIQAGEKVS